MNSKEAKVHIIDTVNGDMNKEYFINEILPKIKKDLDRLEKLEKAFEVLKKSLLLSAVEIHEHSFMKKEEADLIKEALEDE